MKAFPLSNMTGLNQQGMDLRDYFAAKAMQMQINNPLDIYSDETHQIISVRAYRIADAMIKAREEAHE